MISNLHIKNVKCFKDANFNFSPLTIFCGANSAGKSTAIQCLLILRQNYNKHKFEKNKIFLNGEYFSAGHVSDFINHDADGECLSIKVDDISFESKLSETITDEYYISINSNIKAELDFFHKSFHYLSAYRLAPQNSYEINHDTSNINFGIYGEFAISELIRYQDVAAPNQKLARLISQHLTNNSVKLEIAFKEAMKKIVPEFDIKLSEFPDMDKVANAFPTNGTLNSVRPVNTGFGVSYVLPIILAALCTNENGILIVENPEVHLHPSAQSALAEFLTLASTCNIQVIIETHSDHIINGMRATIKEKSLPNDLVTINSIKNVNRERLITEIKISSEGDLSDIDEGFFDQAEKDLMRLF